VVVALWTHHQYCVWHYSYATVPCGGRLWEEGITSRLELSNGSAAVFFEVAWETPGCGGEVQGSLICMLAVLVWACWPQDKHFRTARGM
jgi:hypothetical protein